MSLKTIGRLIVVLSAMAAVYLQLHSKMLVSQSAPHVISRTTSRAPDGSAIYSTSMVGASNTIHWNVILPLCAVFLFGAFLTWMARRKQN